MGLGKILGSISPAFGLISGKGMFGDVGHMLGSHGGIGGLGAFGGLEMLMNLLGGHGGGEEQPAAPAAPQTDVSSIYQGIDPTFLEEPPSGRFAGGMPQNMSGPHFGNFGGQTYLGGQNPVGQNAIGRFLGSVFR